MNADGDDEESSLIDKSFWSAFIRVHRRFHSLHFLGALGVLGGSILYPFSRDARFYGDVDGVARDAHGPAAAMDVNRRSSRRQTDMRLVGRRQFDDLLRESSTSLARFRLERQVARPHARPPVRHPDDRRRRDDGRAHLHRPRGGRDRRLGRPRSSIRLGSRRPSSASRACTWKTSTSGPPSAGAATGAG